MKKITCIFLMLCIAVTLCAPFTAYGEEPEEIVTPYTQLRDHLNAELDEGQSVVLKDDDNGLSVYIFLEPTEGEDDPLIIKTETPMGANHTCQITFELSNHTAECVLNYEVIEIENNQIYHSATVELVAADYTGNELVAFSEVNNIPLMEESVRREEVTIIFNLTLTMLDSYLDDIELSVTDFGFVNLAPRYLIADRAEETETDAEVSTEEETENLGGIFSAERWINSGEMLVLGMGMVFLVLAILWGILAIFAKTMGGPEKPAKQEKSAPKANPKPAPQPAPVQATAVAPAAPASDDAIVAAITAAIAMVIESDPALTEQFAGGFRVVSFKKKSGKTSWNH